MQLQSFDSQLFSNTFRMSLSSLFQAVDLHHSKPLISLVPFNLHFHCFQGQGHCYVTIPIFFPANQKQSFKQVRDRPFQVSDSGDGEKTSEQEISARVWGVGREGFNSSLPLPFFPFPFFPPLFISCPFQLSGCLEKASLCCTLKHSTTAMLNN